MWRFFYTFQKRMVYNRPMRKTLELFLQYSLPGYEDLTMVAGDASFRRYFRVWQHGVSYIVMDAPPTHENVELFVQVAMGFAQAGINVPEIIDSDLDDGYLILSDFGDQPLQSSLTQSPDAWLPLCLQTLLRLQAQGGQHLLELPEYGAELLLRELSLLPEWFITGFLQEKLTDEEESILQTLYQTLIDSALNQPQVWVHRDYHSRNLMKVDDNCLGVIDFQDAVFGPITYDLVSILKDCYIRYPRMTVKHYVEQYYIQLVGRELYHQDIEHFERAFDFMGLQRHLKVLGIFSRLSLRDGKSAYLQDLPLVYDYVMEVLNKYTELHAAIPLFESFGKKMKVRLKKGMDS